MGSAPGDNTKMTGVLFVESEKDLARSKGGGEVYFFPSSLSFLTSLTIAGITLSGLKILSTMIRLNKVSSCHCPGHVSFRL